MTCYIDDFKGCNTRKCNTMNKVIRKNEVNTASLTTTTKKSWNVSHSCINEPNKIFQLTNTVGLFWAYVVFEQRDLTPLSSIINNSY